MARSALSDRLRSAPAGAWSSGLLRRWWIHTTFGELVGFMLPIGMWGGLASAGLSDVALYLPVVIAGAGEGFVLGWAQARVLGDEIEEFAGGEWTRNTALAAGAAWSIGMAPAVISDAFGDAVPDALLIGLGVAAAVVMLLSIGWAQSLVLRRYAQRSGRWVAINALAWFAGLPFTFAALGLAPQETVAHIAVAAAGGLAMAATVALLTGLVLRRLPLRVP